MLSFHAKACLPPFLLGFLALAVQTLLLRQFLWRVEATGIGVGFFLASWLAWVGIGALFAQTGPGGRMADALARSFPIALLLYLPLAVLQFLLIERLRGLVGVPEYLASPIGHMALGALIANAPVSFVTGLLFPAATRWVAARGGSIALAYALDTAGAVAAGLLITALLASGVRLEGLHIRDWQRIFPASRPDGSFSTPTATYLYGSPGGTFYTFSAGGVVDALPEQDRSAEIAALLLSQKPDPARMLLLGHVPLAVALALHEFQPRTQVTWCHDDPAYARQVQRLAGARAHLLSEWSASRLPLVVAGVGPQAFVRDLSHGADPFDLVMIWPASLVSPGGAAMLEGVFLNQVQAALKPDGVVALPLGGGPGAWSPEQRGLAAAIVENADAVWQGKGMLVPGAGCWWLAGGASAGLTDPEAAVLQFGRLGVNRFPAAGAAELYDPMRAAQLLELCRSESPSSDPVARHGFAVALHAEWPAFPLARWVAWLESHAGMAILLLGLGALWCAPAAFSLGDKAPERLVVAWLAAGGFLGLAGLLALMQLLEAGFGNLYLLAGLASSLYLAGMFVGNRMAASGKWLGRSVGRDARAAEERTGLSGSRAPANPGLALVTGVHGVILLGLLPLAARASSPLVVVLACFAAGVPAGWYVPAAVTRLRETGAQKRLAGAVVVGGDALGSALGGMVMSLILLPWMGPFPACLAVVLFAVGIGCCAMAKDSAARFVARVALLACLLAAAVATLAPRAAAGSEDSDGRQSKMAAPAVATNAPAVATNAAMAESDIPPVGNPRQVDLPRMRVKQARGELSTRKAEYWEAVPAERK